MAIIVRCNRSGSGNFRPAWRQDEDEDVDEAKKVTLAAAIKTVDRQNKDKDINKSRRA